MAERYFYFGRLRAPYAGRRLVTATLPLFNSGERERNAYVVHVLLVNFFAFRG